MTAEKILIVDDQKEIHKLLNTVLGKDFQTINCLTDKEGIDAFANLSDEISLVILDLDLGCGQKNGLEILKKMKSISPDVPVIILSGVGTLSSATKAIKLGASDFVEKGMYLTEQLEISVAKTKEFLKVIRENKRLQRIWQYYNTEYKDKYVIIGRSKPLRNLLNQAKKIASVPRPVLIRGERGTGKELLAAYLHYEGTRAKHPFIAVNCASVPENLLESEFFGYEKGAFTGADSMKPGKFELADKGTLFLDEIGNMSLKFQEKILRVIEYQQFERLQGTKKIKVDVRVVAATNTDLKELITKGTFRADLYDRLCFKILDIPPLRDRKEDIPLLIDFFSDRIVHEVPGTFKRLFTPEAMQAMITYDWPGNIRELKNCVERIVCSFHESPVEVDEIYEGRSASQQLDTPEQSNKSFSELVNDYQIQLLEGALQATQFKQTEAARFLGLSYNQFRHLYRKFNIGKLT